MPKLAKPLGALAVRNLKGEGLHAVGVVAGLYLAISKTGTRSWILRTQIGSKRSDIGLGSYPAVTLASAHEKAQATKESIKLGNNPIAERRASRSIVEWTFKRCSEEYIKLHRSGWKNAKHAQQWEKHPGHLRLSGHWQQARARRWRGRCSSDNRAALVNQKRNDGSFA